MLGYACAKKYAASQAKHYKGLAMRPKVCILKKIASKCKFFRNVLFTVIAMARMKTSELEKCEILVKILHAQNKKIRNSKLKKAWHIFGHSTNENL